MAADKELKVAVVGLSVGHAGSIGPERPSLIHNFRQIEGVEVVAYCEYNKPELLKDAEVHHPEANVYTDVDELIAKEDFDIALAVQVPGALLVTFLAAGGIARLWSVGPRPGLVALAALMLTLGSAWPTAGGANHALRDRRQSDPAGQL